MIEMQKGIFRSVTGQKLDRRLWLPEGEPKAVVQLVHGMAEHIDRYDAPARALTAGGCAALRRLRKRLPISAWSGENATGGADGFLWRGCATTPARSAGQQGLGKALPNK